jgi:hypothetical protein
MRPHHIGYALITLFAILGWNAFLIQRDDALYKAYYNHQKIQQQK